MEAAPRGGTQGLLLRLTADSCACPVKESSSFPLRLRYQHEQFALELSKLIHIA